MRKVYPTSYFQDHPQAAIIVILNALLACFAFGWAVVEAWQFHWMHVVRLLLVYIVGCSITQTVTYIHWVLGAIFLFATVFILFHTGA